MGHEMLDRYKTININKQIEITNELMKIKSRYRCKNILESLELDNNKLLK